MVAVHAQRSKNNGYVNLEIHAPFIFFANLLFLLGGEIVFNVELLPNLLRRFALDHVGDSFATQIEQRLNIQVVGGQSNFKQGRLINNLGVEKSFIPLDNIVGAFLIFTLLGLVLVGRHLIGVRVVPLGPFDHFFQSVALNIGQRNGAGLVTEILDHIFDSGRHLGNLLRNFEKFAIRAFKRDHLGALSGGTGSAGCGGRSFRRHFVLRLWMILEDLFGYFENKIQFLLNLVAALMTSSPCEIDDFPEEILEFVLTLSMSSNLRAAAEISTTCAKWRRILDPCIPRNLDQTLIIAERQQDSGLISTLAAKNRRLVNCYAAVITLDLDWTIRSLNQHVGHHKPLDRPPHAKGWLCVFEAAARKCRTYREICRRCMTPIRNDHYYHILHAIILVHTPDHIDFARDNQKPPGTRMERKFIRHWFGNQSPYTHRNPITENSNLAGALLFAKFYRRIWRRELKLAIIDYCVRRHDSDLLEFIIHNTRRCRREIFYLLVRYRFDESALWAIHHWPDRPNDPPLIDMRDYLIHQTHHEIDERLGDVRQHLDYFAIWRECQEPGSPLAGYAKNPELLRVINLIDRYNSWRGLNDPINGFDRAPVVP
jgi:hypothetical protein